MNISYLSHTEQLSVDTFEYVDCGTNSTTPHPVRWYFKMKTKTKAQSGICVIMNILAAFHLFCMGCKMWMKTTAQMHLYVVSVPERSSMQKCVFVIFLSSKISNLDYTIYFCAMFVGRSTFLSWGGRCVFTFLTKANYRQRNLCEEWTCQCRQWDFELAWPLTLC